MTFSHLHTDIYHWYDSHGRLDLPWRNTNNPYHIYLSEVMLQQTQVKTVLDRFYFPFLETFPSLIALAEAPQEKVLKAWEGLGYYSRARNLHKAAQQSAPELPASVEALQALPGIGKNTAHAIAAFAYHQPVPVMEANLKRVLCRFFALLEPSDKALWESAFTLLDTTEPFTYNQAMMDIGAMICTPKQPKCEICPLQAGCRGKNAPHEYALKKPGKAVPTRHKAIIIYQNENGEIWLQPRTTRFLGGLFGFIECDLSEVVPKKHMRKLGSITHTYSHFKLKGDVYIAQANPASPSPQGVWKKPENVSDIPISGADQKAMRILASAC